MRVHQRRCYTLGAVQQPAYCSSAVAAAAVLLACHGLPVQLPACPAETPHHHARPAGTAAALAAASPVAIVNAALPAGARLVVVVAE